MKEKVSSTASANRTDPTDAVIVNALARLDGLALGISIGTLLGLLVFLATIILVLKGGEQIGPNLGLLSNYFIGYEVTLRGSVIGLLYGFGFGFALGWLIALLRNGSVSVYTQSMRLKGSVNAVNDFLDHP